LDAITYGTKHITQKEAAAKQSACLNCYTQEIDMSDMFKDYGYAISDMDGELRDMGGVVAELEEIQRNFSTHAMSDHQLFLQGKAEMLAEVIQYLRRV
jgi:hypothetical protein